MTKCMCGGELQDKQVTLNDVILGVPVRFEGVPAKVCSRCGKRYFSAAVMERVEAYVEHKIAEENAGQGRDPIVFKGKQVGRQLAGAL